MDSISILQQGFLLKMRLNNNYLTWADRYFTDFISSLSKNKKSLEVFSHKHGRRIGNYKPIQMAHTTSHPFIITLSELYGKYNELRNIMPPFFVGYEPTQDENIKIEKTIFRLSTEFADPMLQILRNINANDLVYMLSGFFDLNNMPAFKQEFDSYYERRLTPKQYNLLDEMAPSSAIIRIQPTVYLNRLQKSIDHLMSVLEAFKSNTQSKRYSTLSFSSENVILDIANQLLEIDYIIIGYRDLSAFRNPFAMGVLAKQLENPFEDLTDNPDTIRLVSAEDVRSPFVAFIRDIQKFGARIKQYQAICNALGSVSSQKDFIQAENGFLSIIQMDSLTHNYLSDNSTKRFQLRPVPVIVEPYQDYVIPFRRLKLIYRCNDFKDITKDHDVAVSCFKDALGILEAHKIDPFVYDTLNSITLINNTQYNKALPYVQRPAGLYSSFDKNLSIIFSDFLHDAYYISIEDASGAITREQYLELPPDDQKKYTRMNVYVILHELGHHIHQALMSDKARNTWLQNAWAYDQRLKSFVCIDDAAEHVSKYALTNADEDFAETFAAVLMGVQPRSSMGCTKRLIASLQQAVEDGLTFHEKSFEDIDDLMRMIDSNLARYIGLKTIELPRLFAVSRQASNQKSIFIPSEDTGPSLEFNSANLALGGTQKLIGAIVVHNTFFYKNKYAINQLQDMTGLMLKAILEAFANQIGIDKALQLLVDNEIPADSRSTFNEIIENAVDNYLLPDIMTWGKRVKDPIPKYSELLSKILVDLSIIRKY